MPWKENPDWLKALSKSYTKIEPLPEVEKTRYRIYYGLSSGQNKWTFIFTDGLNGKEIYFEWDGEGLTEKNILLKGK